MTRRRNSINIYDYPEHLNPFREDVDDDSEKFNTTGRRRSSFRENAWAMFSGHKGKSKISEDVNPPSHTTASRFMTWTPKLLRRSFRRSSPSRTSPWDRTSPSSSQISFRSSSSRTSLPPSGSSHSSLHSSRSRSMLPPSSSPPNSLPPKPTSPPNRPAPPNFRPQLSPTQPVSPQSTENIVNSDTTPVPPCRRALYTASSPGKPAGERSTEDEVKYLQQGAKPKKKRRAPLPPGPPPSKSPGDTRQVNSNESEASLTSSITSSSAEEPTSHEQSISTSPDLKVIVHEPEIYPEKENPESKFPVNEEVSENTEVSVPKDSPLDQQNELLEETSKLENNISVSQEFINSNKDETDAQEKFENQTDKDKNVTEVQNEEKEEKPANGIDHNKGSLENLKVNFDVILHISEEDLRNKDPPVQNGSHSKSDVNHNVEHINGNGVTKTDDSVKVEDKENEVKLQNGENGLNESNLSESEMKLNMVNKTEQSPSKTPEPKPRTILPLSKDI